MSAVSSPAPSVSPAPRYVKIALIVSIVLFLYLAQRSFVYVPDDAFITFRYSRNLADGFGPVFNRAMPASDRAEGYSCPLYMAVLALLFKLPLGLDALLRAKFFGILCGIAVLFAATKLAARLNLPGWAIAATPILLAAHAGLSILSVDGMETVFAALLMTLAALSFLPPPPTPAPASEGGESMRFSPSSNLGEAEDLNSPPPLAGAGVGGGGVFSGFLFALCALNRPEALLAGLSATALLLFIHRKSWGYAETRWLLAFLLPVAAWFAFRRAFYGVWLPNTYYAKITSLEESIFKGLTYLLRTFFYRMDESALLFIIGAAWWALAIVGISGERFRRTARLLIPLMVAGQALTALRSGGDWMGGWRYMTAVLPLLMLLSLAGIAEIADALRKVGGAMAEKFTAGILCAALLAACLLGQNQFWTLGAYDGHVSWASKNFSFNERKLLTGWKLERVVLISDWLNAHPEIVPPGSIVAYTEMGVAPYLTPNIRYLDADGLTDRGIATLPDTKHVFFGVDSNYLSDTSAVGVYLRDVRKPRFFNVRRDNGTAAIGLKRRLPSLRAVLRPRFRYAQRNRLRHVQNGDYRRVEKKIENRRVFNTEHAEEEHREHKEGRKILSCCFVFNS